MISEQLKAGGWGRKFIYFKKPNRVRFSVTIPDRKYFVTKQYFKLMRALNGSLSLPEPKKTMLFAALCDARGRAERSIWLGMPWPGRDLEALESAPGVLATIHSWEPTSAQTQSASQVWLHTPLVQGKRENFAAAETGFRDTVVPVETFTAALSKYKFKLRSVCFPPKSSLLSVL